MAGDGFAKTQTISSQGPSVSHLSSDVLTKHRIRTDRKRQDCCSFGISDGGDTTLTAKTMPTAPPAFALPRFYTAFFLILEPISVLAGAFFAHFRPLEYLQLTHASSAPSWESTIPLSTTIVLSQLANLYLLLAVNEALVLRSTSDLRVWRTVLFTLLLADFGHLYSVKGLGAEIYWNVLKWNRMDWGNVGFVYAGATMRMMFLAGVGMDTTSGREAAQRAKKSLQL